MSHFKKLADAMQFSPEKMKKNGLFETDRFFCDTYCFEPRQEQSPHTQAGRIKFIMCWKGTVYLRSATKSASWAQGKSRWRPPVRIMGFSIAVGNASSRWFLSHQNLITSCP